MHIRIATYLMLGILSNTHDSTVLASDHWNQWLGGPQRQNAVLTQNEIQTGKKLVPRLSWQREIGSGYSSIAIQDDRLVVLMNDGNSDFAVALRADSGAEIWRYRLGKKYKGHDGSIDGPLSTPAINARYVLALSAFGKLVCLDMKNGAEIWTRKLPWDFGAKTPHYGFATSPLLLDERVIIQASGKGLLGDGRSLAALDLETGETIWQVATDRNEYASPALAMIADTPQVIVQGDGRVFSVQPLDGREIWSITVGATSSWTPMPLADDRVFVSAAESSYLLQVIKSGKDWTVNKIWQSDRFAGSISPMTQIGDLLVGVQTRKLAALSLRDGELAWKSKTDAFPIRIGDRVVALADREGVLKVGKATQDRWEVESELKLYDNPIGRLRVESPMAYANGTLYVRTDFAVFAVSLSAE